MKGRYDCVAQLPSGISYTHVTHIVPWYLQCTYAIERVILCVCAFYILYIYIYISRSAVSYNTSTVPRVCGCVRAYREVNVSHTSVR